MILTVDLGTSATKVAAWDETGMQSAGRATLDTAFGADGRAEQDPAVWWASVVEAADGVAGDDAAAVDAIGFAAARQTFVPVDADGTPLGPGILWSDRRAAAEADELARAAGGVDAVHRRTGSWLDGGSVAAKVAWLARHEPERLAATRWLLAPRDLVVRIMTGEVATDLTLASASGLYDGAGELVGELAGAWRGLLPDVVPSATVVGTLRADAARALGLPAGVPVVIGAGDRAAEVVGAGASTSEPMVSWGTTANVSLPSATRPDPPDGLSVTRGALGGWVLEGGLSAAGSLLDWLGRLTGLDAAELWSWAAGSPPGSRGVVALPWLGGARAPWWSGAARAAFAGLSPEHDAGDLARAAVEGVARDVARCLELAAAALPARYVAVVAGGGGSRHRVWTEALTGTTGLPARTRASSELASAGAAVVASAAIGGHLSAQLVNPPAATVSPDPAVVAAYRALRPAADDAAHAVLGLGRSRPS